MARRRRTTTIAGGLFALLTVLVTIVVSVSGSARGTAVPVRAAAAAPTAPAPATPPDLAGTLVAEHSLSIGGVKRTYRSIVPTAASQQALPLLVVLHGRGQQPWTAVRSTGFLPYARQDRAVLVYPDGLARSWNAGSGCCGAAGTRGTPDTAFVTAVIADAVHDLPVDPDRIYLVGYSNGGKLAWLLTCTHPTLFAAVATYGAAPLSPCQGAKPLPSLMAVGVHDHVLPMGGDPRVHPPLPSTRVAADWLVQRDRCTAAPVTSTVGGAVLQRWTQCAPGTEVDLAVYPGADHYWPAAVSQLMWTFLDSRRLSAPVPPVLAGPRPTHV
ncbi:MAG TPA: PHB depolymerase family esterase [Pseudonocardia sp.]